MTGSLRSASHAEATGRLDRLRPATAARPRPRYGGTELAIAVVVAGVPIVVASGRRAVERWQPTGDWSNVARLSYDVFTRHTPLLGMPSTIGAGRRPFPHHLGPMVFWVLAVPLRIFASSPFGLLVGVTTVNVAALIGVAVFVRRRVGPGAAVWALGLLMLVFFSLGQTVISSIVNPDIAVVPLAFFVVLAWSLADGDLLALPFGALVGSFVAQAHLVYVPLVFTVGLWGVVGLVSTRVRRARTGSAVPGRLGRSVLVTVVVLAVCWSTAVYQVLTKLPGGGNVSAVVHSYERGSGPPIGLWQGLHFVTHLLTVVPLWARPLRGAEYAGLYRSPSAASDLTALLVFAALVVALARAWRRDATVRALLVTALLALGVTLWSVTRMPAEYGVVPDYRVRFAWVTGPFVVFALGVALIRLRSTAPMAVRTAVAGGVAALLVTGSAAATLQNTPIEGPDPFVVVRTLSDQLRTRLPTHRPYVLPRLSFSLDAPAVDDGVTFALARHGYDIRSPRDDPYFGDAHPPPRGRVDALLVIDQLHPLRHPSGTVLLASYRIGGSLARQADRSAQQLCARLGAHPPIISATARSAVQSLPTALRELLLRLMAGPEPPCQLARESAFPALVAYGFVSVPGLTFSEVSRTATLLDRVMQKNYDVYLVPQVDANATDSYIIPLSSR